jgi:hypothetical protein
MRYYIYVYYKKQAMKYSGPIEDQPEDGFESEEEAEKYLLNKIEEKKGNFFDRAWYNFVILKTYKSKSAV